MPLYKFEDWPTNSGVNTHIGLIARHWVDEKEKEWGDDKNHKVKNFILIILSY